MAADTPVERSWLAELRQWTWQALHCCPQCHGPLTRLPLQATPTTPAITPQGGAVELKAQFANCYKGAIRCKLRAAPTAVSSSRYIRSSMSRSKEPDSSSPSLLHLTARPVERSEGENALTRTHLGVSDPSALLPSAFLRMAMRPTLAEDTSRREFLGQSKKPVRRLGMFGPTLASPSYLRRSLGSVGQGFLVTEYLREVCLLGRTDCPTARASLAWQGCCGWDPRTFDPSAYRTALACSLIPYPPSRRLLLRVAVPASVVYEGRRMAGLLRSSS
jgi:hypothetical protein